MYGTLVRPTMFPRSNQWPCTMIRTTAEHWIPRRSACCVRFSEHCNPGVQSMPQLNASISLLCGSVCGAIVQTAKEANMALRFAKANSDACLQFRHLGLLSQTQLGAWEKIFRVKEGKWSFLHISSFLKATWTSPMWFLIGAATSCPVWVEAVWMWRVKHVQQLWVPWSTCYTFGEHVGNSNIHCKTWRSR